MGKRLTDLYVLGRELEFEGGEITVWLQKLNPVEHERAITRAQAKRARVLAASKNDPNSDEFLAIEAEVVDKDIDWLVSYLIQDEQAQAFMPIEARVAEENEWNKDGYLDGLRDSWEGVDDVPGLKEAYARGEEDEQYPDAKHAFEELSRFSGEVKAILEQQGKETEHNLRQNTLEVLQKMVIEKLLKTESDMAWIQEFRLSQIWLSVRDPKDHKKYYFTSREEVDDLQLEIRDELLSQYENLEVPALEGKESEEVQDSSVSPEQPQDSSEPSGPVSAAA